MKKIYLLLIAIAGTISSFAQLRYDDGPIIEGARSNFVTVGSWGRSNITFSFQNGTTDIANSDEHNAVRQAFQIWADYGNLNFTEVASGGDIVISWATGNHGDGTNNAFDGQDGVLAHAFFPPPNGSFAGDIHFDDDEQWTMAMQVFGWQPIDLVTVAAHEIGHALGLDHSNVTCALMNPFYTGSHRYLSQDDVDGIQTLYGNRTVVRTTGLNCSGGTFFINNLPVGATVNWTSSNTNIATVANNNNQGVVSWSGTSSGSVRITGMITLPCGTTVEEFMDGVAFGIKSPTYIDYSVDPYVTCNEVRVTTNYFPDATYTWSYFKVPYSGNLVQFPNSPSTKKLSLNQGSGNYSIGVTAANSCGTSNIYFITTSYITCDGGGGGGHRYSVSPNPGKDNINVQLAFGQKSTALTKPAIKTIKIYDNMGLLRGQWKYAQGISQASINTANLGTGIYIIEISDGKTSEKQQLIIQK
jgi:hypothetical protein